MEQLKKGDAVHRRTRFIFCCAILAALCVLALTGCASYQLHHKTTTTTSGFMQTKKVVVVEYCQLSIESMREVRSGDLSINQRCEVQGAAGALGASAEAIGLIKDIVRKVP